MEASFCTTLASLTLIVISCRHPVTQLVYAMNNCPVSAGLLYLNMPASIACYAYVIQYVHICLEKCVGKKERENPHLYSKANIDYLYSQRTRQGRCLSDTGTDSLGIHRLIVFMTRAHFQKRRRIDPCKAGTSTHTHKNATTASSTRLQLALNRIIIYLFDRAMQLET